MAITQSETDRVVTVIYCQYENSVADNNPHSDTYGEYVDRAQNMYETYGKHLAKDVSEWDGNYLQTQIKGNYTVGYNWGNPLTASSELLFGGSRTLKIHHFGLDENTDTITPFIITDQPYGYYNKKAPIAQLNGILPENANGWESWPMVGNPFDTSKGLARFYNLVRQIFTSGYFKTHYNNGLVYNRNIENYIDYLIIAMPVNQKFRYYLEEDCSSSISLDFQNNSLTLYDGLPNEININAAKIQPIDSERVLLHEYIHGSYLGYYPVTQPTTTVLDNVTLICFTHDIYHFSLGSGTVYGEIPRQPWGWCPMRYCAYMDGSTEAYLLSPMIAGSQKLTALDRIISYRGNYEIMNEADSWDYIVVKSPYDPLCYCILYCYYPKTINGGTAWNKSYANRKGVYAVIVKLKDTSAPPAKGYWNYSSPISMIGIDSMTEIYNYADINNDEYISGFPTILNKQPVLIDFTDPDGITTIPFGITVKWVGWKENVEIPTAIIKIDGLPDEPEPPEPPDPPFYGNPIKMTLTESCTVKARAFKRGSNSSETVTATYIIEA